MIAKIKYHLLKTFNRMFRRGAFERFILSSLPEAYRDVARFLFYGKPAEAERAFSADMESLRKRLIEEIDHEIYSYSSPHSGEFELNADGRSAGGPFKASGMEAHIRAGSGAAGGILLRRIADAVPGRCMLEFGTHMGFSAAYLLSSKSEMSLVTVEGSKDLCDIAESHLEHFKNRYRILNMLFDEAVDLLLSEKKESFDLVFIDGQHEKEATLYYTKRVLPLVSQGGVFVFDDIYWSEDMRSAWQALCEDVIFSLTIDLGDKGIGVLDEGEEVKRHVDICPYTARPPIYRKGW